MYFIHFIFILQIVHQTLAQKSKADVKVVVIGAGAAGLHSAYKLTEAGVKNVIVLEANDRIGGRINSIPINGKWIEFGAQWIHGQGKNPLWKFVDEKKILISKITDRAGEGIFLRDDGKAIPSTILGETSKVLWDLGDNCVDEREAKKEVERASAGSVGDFLDSEFQSWLTLSKPNDSKDTAAWRKQLYKWFLKVQQFDSAADNLYNQSEISWCNYVDILPDTSFLDGFQSLINVWRDALAAKNVTVQTKTKVTQILWQNTNGAVTVRTQNGTPFVADHVIITVSLGVLKQQQSSLFVPRLPAFKAQVINTLKIGATDKIFLEFERPFWDLTNPGFQFLWNGDEVYSQQINASNWVRYVFGFDSIINQPNMLVGWIAGPPAKFMEKLSNEVIAKGVLDHLTNVMRKWKNNPSFVLPNLKQILVTRWHSDPLFLGSYSYRETDSDPLDIWHSDLATPLSFAGAPRVLFAGEATTDNYYSAVHGAVDSARREVERLLQYVTA